MIIDISKSKMFCMEPDERFAREFGVRKGLWTEMFKRYVLDGYTQGEILEYLMLKTGRRPSEASICRWIIRSRIYSISSPVLKKGATHVNSSIFGEYEMHVIKEMTKHVRSGASSNPKAII